MLGIVLFIVFLLFAPASVLADDGDSLRFSSGATSVALPGQAAYTGQGLSFGFGSGIYVPIEKCDCMGSWQVQASYFYTDWLSGGGEVRFFGGDLDPSMMVMYQRYRVNVQFHLVHDDIDVFAQPFLGLENTNISEFRKQVSGEKRSEKKSPWWEGKKEEKVVEDSVSISDDDCWKLFSMDGFSVGLGIGLGYNLSRYFALTGLVQGEYNFSHDVMLSIVPGVAFNLWEVWPWAKRNLRSTWISFEIGGQRYFNRDVKDWSNTFFLGIQLGA